MLLTPCYAILMILRYAFALLRSYAAYITSHAVLPRRHTLPYYYYRGLY